MGNGEQTSLPESQDFGPVERLDAVGSAVDQLPFSPDPAQVSALVEEADAALTEMRDTYTASTSPRSTPASGGRKFFGLFRRRQSKPSNPA